MNLIRLLISSSVLLVLIVPEKVFCQQDNKKLAAGEYRSQINLQKEQEPIYRGAEYRHFRNYIAEGFVFYLADTMTPGKVVYYGKSYDNIPLVYDEVTDELLTRNITGNALLVLLSVKVDSFNIYNQPFIYIRDSTRTIQQGFWQVLHDSRSKVYQKEIKKISDKIFDGKIYRYIESRVIYALKRDDIFYPIRNRESLIEAFGDDGKQVRNYLKTNRRKLRKAPFKNVVLEAARYFDTVANTQ